MDEFMEISLLPSPREVDPGLLPGIPGMPVG